MVGIGVAGGTSETTGATEAAGLATGVAETTGTGTGTAGRTAGATANGNAGVGLGVALAAAAARSFAAIALLPLFWCEYRTARATGQDEECTGHPGGEAHQKPRGRADERFHHSRGKRRSQTLTPGALQQDHRDEQQAYEDMNRQQKIDQEVHERPGASCKLTRL